MVAVILAAGKGSRLGEYTRDLPKSLLKLDREKTLLDYNLDILNQFDLDRILIITGYNSELIESHVNGASNIEIIYNPFWNHCNVLGSLYMGMNQLNDDFLFLHADTLADKEIWESLVGCSGDMVLPFQRKECGDEEMKVLIKEQKLIRISKEISPIDAQGEFLGIAKFSKKTLPFFKKTAERLFKTGQLNQYMEAVIQEAVDLDSFEIIPMDIGDFNFVEVDFEEDYLRAKTEFGKSE
ncbi:MAG: phosphocholine cytidylyltransferase family protein [Eudoraea sp.]|nr:phosphocholine cytidylyltransferase family protein [Eudoraea sp.]